MGAREHQIVARHTVLPLAQRRQIHSKVLLQGRQDGFHVDGRAVGSIRQALNPDQVVDQEPVRVAIEGEEGEQLVAGFYNHESAAPDRTPQIANHLLVLIAWNVGEDTHTDRRVEQRPPPGAWHAKRGLVKGAPFPDVTRRNPASRQHLLRFSNHLRRQVEAVEVHVLPGQFTQERGRPAAGVEQTPGPSLPQQLLEQLAVHRRVHRSGPVVVAVVRGSPRGVTCAHALLEVPARHRPHTLGAASHVGGEEQVRTLQVRLRSALPGERVTRAKGASAGGQKAIQRALRAGLAEPADLLY